MTVLTGDNVIPRARFQRPASDAAIFTDRCDDIVQRAFDPDLRDSVAGVRGVAVGDEPASRMLSGSMLLRHRTSSALILRVVMFFLLR